jgi:hypothetical protein
MSLSSSTLSAIQKVGAAAFAADLKLKNEVTQYAERVNAAIASNPYNLGNDALFANWKTVARLSQAMVGIEEEIRKVFQVASELSADNQAAVGQTLAIAAPSRAVKKAAVSQKDVTPTATRAKTKKPKQKSKTVPRTAAATTSADEQPVAAQANLMSGAVAVKPKKKSAAPKVKTSPSKRAAGSEKKVELSGNPAKLLQHFERVLNANEFTEINQTIAGQETGIPLGSMTAAIKKLVAMGRIVAGPNGSLKLVNSPLPLEA